LRTAEGGKVPGALIGLDGEEDDLRGTLCLRGALRRPRTQPVSEMANTMAAKMPRERKRSESELNRIMRTKLRAASVVMHTRKGGDARDGIGRHGVELREDGC
jgi:hypothetical protein